MTTDRNPPRLLFLIPEDWYVCSHRLPLIVGARAAGMAVTVVTRIGHQAQPIRDAGAEVLPSNLRRGFRTPLRDLKGFLELVGIYRTQRPTIVHHVTPKSCLFGSLAAIMAGIPAVINAMAGLGFLYTSRSLSARLARPLVTLAFRLVLMRPATRVIVQNDEDAAFFRQQLSLESDRIVIIRGSGVDTDRFRPVATEPPGKLRICLVARMIREKGLHETVAAARILAGQRDDLEFVFVGEPDEENPSGVPAAQLQAWHDEGIVTWLGRIDDVASVLNSCHLALLPTYYREGFPKSLLEAAACGLPLIATDTTGCRDICLDGENGLSVPIKDVPAIVAAVTKLADDPALRARFGAASRRLVVEKFAEEIVVRQTMDLYRQMSTG